MNHQFIPNKKVHISESRIKEMPI